MSPILIPPGVCGRNRGTISISVEEVFWSGTPQGDIYVKFAWWGSDEVYEFFPKDLTRFKGKRHERNEKQSSEKANSFTFPVGTSIRLLENYFKKWKSMIFNVYRIKDKRYVGCALVENLECILADSRFSSYFPILDKKGVKLGDLQVVFSLQMKKKKYKLKSDFPIVRNLPLENVWGAGDNDLLADLVSRGQELRKDMVKSVLSSCEAKDVDEVIEEKLPPARPSEEDRDRKAKLVDFLMGKDLTEPEKEIAMKTLRCTSPSDSILEVTATIADNLRENSTQAYEDTYQKKFCSVGEKKALSVEDKPFSDGRGGQTCARSNIFGKETHHQIPALDDFRLDNVSRQSFCGTQKVPGYLVNSFRITFGVMTLTALGLKKVSTSPTIKPLSNRIRPAKSPGIVFSLETVMPYSPKCKPASLKPVTLSSKAFGGNDVVFNDSITQKFRQCKDSAWLKVNEHISGFPIKVYWRCLNQRLPSLLGQCLLPDDLASEDFESSFHLTIQTATKQAAAMLACKVELGTSKVFGNELLGDDKKIKKTRLESMLPQMSEVPPSRASVVSEKTLSQENSKESFSFPPPPIPPPSSRCRTASSATSTNIREPSEPDHHLINAISNLNEKLTKKSVQVRIDDVDENAKDKDSEKSKPTSARFEEPRLQNSFEAADNNSEKSKPTSARFGGTNLQNSFDAAGAREAEGGGGACQIKSPRRGCCCCCRGCPGDCKRRKSVRKKHLRDRRPSSYRESAAKHDEQTSTGVSNSEGGMSPGDQEILAQVNAYLRGSRFHSPPTKLTRKHRNTGQASRLRETTDQPKKLDTLFNDDQAPREFKSKIQLESTYTKNRRKEFATDDKYLARSPEELPSVHRFNINVYSSDAQIFYREGELELYMAYRFPQTDPVSGKLFCPAEVSSIELSGDAAPVTHYLPLRTSLSEALLTYPKQNVTFHVWARAYMYEKRDFLIGQAKLPLEKLVEWEAAHIYSQKRRTEHPLLPPDKHFINLRIHPSKVELPHHLEPGRIAQLGLEIDYEKFRDVGNESFDRWPLNLAPPTDSPPIRPYYSTSHARDQDPGDLYSNGRRGYDNDSVRWANPSFDHQDFHPSPPPGDWGVRLVNSFSGREDSRMHASSKFESGRKARLGLGNDEPRELREEDELMLILDGRTSPNPVAGDSARKTNPYNTLPPERQVPEDRLNGTWGDANLQYHSTSRIEPANTSNFAPDPECLHRLQSPRVDRDFPAGVQTADITSPNNSDCHISPFEASVTVHPPPIPKPAANTRMRIEDQPSPLPALARAIDPNYCANKGPSPIQNLDSSFDLGSESKATQTTVDGQTRVDLFSVRIEVEAAINLLPSLQNGVHSQPSSRVEFDAWSKGREIIVQSSVVNDDANPKYDSAWNVELPAHLLYKGESEFELRVVNIDDGTVSTAFIDLTTLSAGLPSIDGWYFLSSHGHKSAGQVKVSITPMESIRKYRDEWIEEFRKKKHESKRCNDDRISCDSAQRMMLNDSSSTKFKEKMKELEQLTERMKQKLLNVERWDNSPPCTLMKEVNDFAQQLVQESNKSADNRTKKTIRASTPSQGLPELDMRTVQEFCPVDSDGDHDFHPNTSTVTAENTPRAFLDYVPASRIRKPFSKTLSASRSFNNRVNFFSDDLLITGTEFSPILGSKSPVNLISFDDSQDEHQTYSLPLNSYDTSPTSPVNVLIGEKFEDSDDSAGILGSKLSLEKCHKELEQLPKDSLDAASIAIEQMIADLRNQKIDDSKS